MSAPGSGTQTINSPIADVTGKTGFLATQGGGTLVLGGMSIDAGETPINNGTVQLTGGPNRLPTSTSMRVGQAGSTNVGSLNRNGNDQAIAGLASTSGINTSPTANNTITSVAPATLTVAFASGTAIYGDGTAANSGLITGLITGAVSLVKTGAGVQVLGRANTYTGTTLVSGGSLLIASGGNLLFDTTKTLTASGTSISCGGFGIATLVELSQITPDGLYSLLDGTATLDPANLSNVGGGNAFVLGRSKSAYFSTSRGLSVAVVPEPSTLAVAAAGLNRGSMGHPPAPQG